MANVLKDEKKQQIIALGRLGWSLRKIQETTRVRRETISVYLRGAGVEIWPPGRWKREGKAKPAIEVITGSEAAKPAIPESAGQPNFNPNPNRENLSTKGKAKATSKPAIAVITGFGVGLSGQEPGNTKRASHARVRVSFATLAAGKRNTGVSPLISICVVFGAIACRCSNVL